MPQLLTAVVFLLLLNVLMLPNAPAAESCYATLMVPATVPNAQLRTAVVFLLLFLLPNTPTVDSCCVPLTVPAT